MKTSDPYGLPYMTSEAKQLRPGGRKEDWVKAQGFSDLESLVDCGWHFPRGTNSTTIGPGGGYDYTDVQDWADTECTGTLTDDQEGEIQEAYDALTTAGLDFDAVTNAAGYWCKLTVAEGVRFNDVSGGSWPDMGGSEGEGARLIGSASFGAAVVIYSTGTYIVEWLEIQDTVGGYVWTYSLSAIEDPSIEVRNCLLHDCVNSTAGFYDSDSDPSTWLVHNNAMYGGGIDTIWARRSNTDWYIYHNSIYGSGGDGITYGSPNTLEIYGNVVLDSTNDDYAGGTATGADYNMASDTTAPGSNSWDSYGDESAADEIFESVTGGSEDLHLLESLDGTYESPGYAAVSRLDSGNLGTSDLDGNARSDWDIGCADIPGGAGEPALAGSGSITLGGDGTLTVTHDDLEGSGSITLGGSGQHAVTASCAGSGSITFGGSGDSTTAVPVTGSGAITFGGSGDVTTAAPLAGSGTITLGGNGQLATAAIPMSGSSSITLGGAGQLSVAAAIPLSGSGSITLGGSGSLSVVVTLAGSGAITFGGSGQAQTAGSSPLAGSGSIVLGGSGQIDVVGPVTLAGTGSITLGGTGTALVAVLAAGQGSIVLAGSGRLSLKALRGVAVATLRCSTRRPVLRASTHRPVLRCSTHGGVKV